MVRKRILFVHQNYPGQFVHLAPALSARGHDVIGLTAETNRRASPAAVLRYRHEVKPFPHDEWRIAAHFADQARRGERTARAAMQLKRNGYYPDIVYGHAGWGETLFLADVWPDARHVGYAEFFYNRIGQDVGFDPEFDGNFEHSVLALRARQASQLLALETVQRAISPTVWQASTYPDHIRGKITVIHDGIDALHIRPDEGASVELMNGRLRLHQGDEVLTFVNRNLEPYRGFHVFMRALPAILKARPQLCVVVVGGDAQSYGSPPPRYNSWREFMLAELKGQLDLARLHFVGKIPYPSFIKLMKVTRVHAYLTYPFVLSWSLLEAMSAGALIIGSATNPVEEVISHGDNGILVQFFDVKAWAEAIVRSLAQPELSRDIRVRARESIIRKFDLRSICLPEQIRMIEGL